MRWMIVNRSLSAKGETSMQMGKACTIINFFLAVLLVLSVGCTQPLTKREQGGLIGGGIGAASGAIIGSSVGHATAGALIGGPIGLLPPSPERRSHHATSTAT